MKSSSCCCSSCRSPAICLEFTILGEIFAYVTVFLNPTIQVVTIRLRGYLLLLLCTGKTRDALKIQFCRYGNCCCLKSLLLLLLLLKQQQQKKKNTQKKKKKTTTKKQTNKQTKQKKNNHRKEEAYCVLSLLRSECHKECSPSMYTRILSAQPGG